jgi:hypothetical protein
MDDHHIQTTFLRMGVGIAAVLLVSICPPSLIILAEEDAGVNSSHGAVSTQLKQVLETL